MSVDISTTPALQIGVAQLLFKAPTVGTLFWDVTFDGKLFVITVPAGQSSSAPYTVVLNWQSALKK